MAKVVITITLTDPEEWETDNIIEGIEQAPVDCDVDIETTEEE